MFKLNEKYEVDRRMVKCVFIQYSPAETATKINPISQIYIKRLRGDLCCFFVK